MSEQMHDLPEWKVKYKRKDCTDVTSSQAKVGGRQAGLGTDSASEVTLALFLQTNNDGKAFQASYQNKEDRLSVS